MQTKFTCLSAFVLLCCLVVACRNTKNKDTSTKPSTSIIASSKSNSSKTIAENITSDSSFTILGKALAMTELLETLKTSGPFTVFTPANVTFDKLPPGLLESLMGKRRDDFANILSYHIVAGSIKANDFKDGEKIKTLAGEELTVSVRNDKVSVNGTNVVEADIESSNGMIHVIDGILFPRNQNAAAY